MCTAVTYRGKKNYFGRNLDYEFSYGESVTIVPRKYPLAFRGGESTSEHYAMIGMAHVAGGYPLYYDAINEAGVGVAGLNFPGNAAYLGRSRDKVNVAPFEFIPYILGGCASVAEARAKLAKINIWGENFSPELPASPLHWMISDGKESIVVEPLKDGVKVYDDPADVMTNNPTFDYHMTNLVNYMGAGCGDPENRFSSRLALKPYSRGMGTLGIPGDLSSASRFVKAAFTLLNTPPACGNEGDVSAFFHILTSVEQQKGCCKVEHGFEYTIYSSCCDLESGIYYFTTYDDRRIKGVDMREEDLGGDALVSYPLGEAAPPEIVNAKRKNASTSRP